MKRCVLVLVLSVTATWAQSPIPSQAASLQPYQEKALENALRSPKAATHNHWPGLFSTSPFRHAPIFTPAVSEASELGTACAIPLLLVPANGDIDSGIRQGLKPDSSSADPMPTFKGLPTCAAR